MQQMNKEEINQMAELFKTLSDPARVRIIWMLNKEICVSELAEKLNMTQSAVSHQLSVLKVNGLVKKRRDGKQMYYRLTDNHVRQVLEIGIEHINDGKGVS